MTEPLAITFADIEDAAARLRGQVVETPLLESPVLNDLVGGRLLVKAECLQRTGAFKLRGATNALAVLDAETRARGVVTHSSGNHAQAIAAAAKAWGVPATIVMPDDAPALKVALTKAHGARVIQGPRSQREELAAQAVTETGGVLIPPFDHSDVIAGQGTAGLEIMDQCAARDVVPDQVLVCCGGGGLTTGIATAVKGRNPGTAVWAVEPENYDDWVRSLEAGEIRGNGPLAPTLCDAVQTQAPGKLTFPIGKALLTGAVAVSEEDVKRAMVLAFLHLKIVVEPGGAVALAAALAGKVPTEGKTTVVTASGGNVDPEVFARILTETVV
ncbi:MAG: threonine/serine dehydratase [Rhodospirillum sp.]|nr:threonine/serine dehydratase [Rhodospirillum sp.]MCF8488681.1 threonine/serine dehydratase [Rhodospirillum sp.]MCF8502567.1 threonine/serine dehydratase [Rhodospirillum sp.]